MSLVLNHIDVIAADVAASVAFYRTVGVDIPQEKVWEVSGEAHHVEVDMGNGLTLSIDSHKLTKAYDKNWTPAGSQNYLIFSLPTRDAVDELYAKVTDAGYASHLEPFDVFWGARYAIVDDPDGNHVGFMSPSDKEHQSAPGF